MSNQDRLLSDEELRDSIVKCFSFIELTPSVNTVDNLEKLINTQKRLYAESELSKLKHKASYDPSGSSPVINPREIDAAIAEQRARIK